MNYREERLRAGYSQAEVAEAIGASQAQVSGWERGAFQPSFTHRTALSNLFIAAAVARARQARLDDKVMKKLDELLDGSSAELRKRMLRRIMEASASTTVNV